MHLPAFDYRRPANLAEALGWLAEAGPRAAVLAGGTDLLVSLRQRLVAPEVVIGIGGLPELQGIAATPDGGLRLGAGCTLSTLIRDPALGLCYPSLVAALRSVASKHVRNVATLGGNLNLPTRCWYTNQSEAWRSARPPCFKTRGEVCYVIRSATECFAVNSADSAVALLTLEARLELQSAAGARELPIRDFYRNDGLAPTTLNAGELVTAVLLPPATDRTAFIKLAPRAGLDYGLGTIAAAIGGSNRRVTRARLVVGSVSSWPVELPSAGRCLEEGGLTDEAIEAAVESARGDLGELVNLYSSAGYKRRLVRALVRRVLQAVRAQKAAPGATA